MRFRFTIFDRQGVSHPIDEPIGWDGSQFNIKRDIKTHGIVFEFGTDNYVYTGLAAKLLQEEYEQYGVQGVMSIVVEEVCRSESQVLDIARFVFKTYERAAGSECGVRCRTDNRGDLMTFRNRIDQKVNLLSRVAYDKETQLPSYAGLDRQFSLPGKSIYVEDSARNDADNATAWMGSYSGGSSGGTIDFQHVAYFIPGADNNIGAEIGSFSVPSDATESYDALTPQTWSLAAHPDWVPLPYFDAAAPDYLKYFPIDTVTPVVNYDKELGNEFGDISVTMEGKFDARIANHIHVQVPLAPQPVTAGIYSFNLYLGILKAEKDPHNADSWNWVSDNVTDWGRVGYAVAGTTPQDVFHVVAFNEPLVLHPGDRIYYFYTLCYAKFNAQATETAFDITYYEGAYFRLHGLSKIPATTVKTFLINEAWSRVAEAITDDKIRAYSEYFGRVDSQPYSHNVDGEGSLACITNGKFIRRLEEIRPDQPPQLNISIKDLLAGLNPIHNIGMGLEPDPMRPGFNRLRIESWRHFYQQEVVLECRGITDLTISAEESEAYSTFKFGFAKWEAEAFNGIDEFLTDREYRTDLSEVNNMLTQLSTFILSGYAIEVTRRKGNEKSEDWRYDNDVFMIALRKTGISHKVYSTKFNNSSIRFKSNGGAEPWMVPGAQFTVSGAVKPGNNRAFTIVSIVLNNGIDVQFTVSPVPVNDAVTQNVTITRTFSAPQMEVEQGGIINDLNIIDPATILNFRHTPLRMAMKWLPEVLRSYRRPDLLSKITFTDGSGNYYAAGEHETDFYPAANGVITENQTLTPANMKRPQDGIPSLYAERAKYSFPLTVKEYRLLKARPWASIYYESANAAGYGWIENVTYKPVEGMAQFTLIPKI